MQSDDITTGAKRKGKGSSKDDSPLKYRDLITGLQPGCKNFFYGLHKCIYKKGKVTIDFNIGNKQENQDLGKKKRAPGFHLI